MGDNEILISNGKCQSHFRQAFTKPQKVCFWFVERTASVLGRTLVTKLDGEEIQTYQE